MNLHDYLSVAPEIAEALAAGKPVVALESTILSHGMPYPENVEFAHKVEKIVREEGAIPATTAIIGGKLKVGLNDEELLTMCKAENVGKVSRRDVAVYLATGQTGATTVATTMIIASLAGIRFFATGGIGGVLALRDLTGVLVHCRSVGCRAGADCRIVGCLGLVAGGSRLVVGTGGLIVGCLGGVLLRLRLVDCLLQVRDGLCGGFRAGTGCRAGVGGDRRHHGGVLCAPVTGLGECRER